MFSLRLTATVIGMLIASSAFGDPMVEIIAHRGASWDSPENTVAAIKLAWKHGADGSEFDVHMTKDGKLIVIHDADTKRVTGAEGKVTEKTLAELRKLDAGNWKGAQFTGEKLPTLEEMLETIPPGKRVFVELKTGPEIVPELDRVLKASKRRPEETPVIAFNAATIAAVKKLRPDLQAYWLVGLKEKEEETRTAADLIAKAKAIHADGLDLSASSALDKDFADQIKATGLKLYVWTVNNPAVARRMVSIGVDGITTDRPAWLREQLAK